MSENIPESIPTSMDPRSQRPTKKRALSPTSQQSAHLTALFKNPERNINITKAKDKSLAPPPEIVANVQGSSAGAGSGEFHVYKASRRREYERLKMMDEEVKKEKEQEEFETKAQEMRRKDEERTAKNRAKRNKKKGNKDGKDKTNGQSPLDVNSSTEEGNGKKVKEMEQDAKEVPKASVKNATNDTAPPSVDTSRGMMVFDDDD